MAGSDSERLLLWEDLCDTSSENNDEKFGDSPPVLSSSNNRLGHESYKLDNRMQDYNDIQPEVTLDDSVDSRMDNTTCFYNNVDGLICVEKRFLPDDENTKILPVLLNHSSLRNRISTTVPRFIDSNSSFIVDLDKLGNPADILCDELGSWKQTDVKRKNYTFLRDSSGAIQNVAYTSLKSTQTVCAVRRTYRNKSDETLSKLIVIVELPDGRSHNLVYIRYKFTGREHEIVVKPHGNSKSNIPYLRTYKSTKMRLEKELGASTPVSRALFNVSKEVGGVEHSKCGGVLPKGKNQAMYILGKNHVKDDPIFQVTQKIKEAAVNRGTEKFVRCYTLDDNADPKIIAFTDNQINDIINFCCNDTSNQKSLLYADITFQLGPFFLLLTVYKNTTLNVKGTNTSPTMIGPFMLCLLKEEKSYLPLFQKITAECPGIKSYLQGYASDSEKALRNALAHEFPHSISFLCGIHVKKKHHREV